MDEEALRRCQRQSRGTLFGFKGTKNTEFDVVKNFPSFRDTLHVVFTPGRCTITYKAQGQFRSLVTDDAESLGVKRDGMFMAEVVGKEFFFTLDSTSVTVEQMGETLIQALLEWWETSRDPETSPAINPAVGPGG